MTETGLVEVRADEWDESLGCEPMLLFWYVGEGDTVAQGQELCEIESAKAVFVITAPCDGQIEQILCAESAAVESGHLLATMKAG